MGLRSLRCLFCCALLLCATIASASNSCETDAELRPYASADSRPFVRLKDGALSVDNAPFHIHGVNYYPLETPWRRFLLETELTVVNREFELLRAVGFNTLRIFLWNGALFQCEGKSNKPNPAAFERLDKILQLASQYRFRLIVTLNDMPDLDLQPLYDNPPLLQDQTALIVRRYLNEPAILAWDLRNEGDIDYGSRSPLQRRFSRVKVLEWLRKTAELIRSIDRVHLLTAGWLNEAHSTAPAVDFLSFHHWTSARDLQRRIRALRLASSKPILLGEIGYSTHDGVSAKDQANALRAAIEISEQNELLGWMIWTAFDFPLTATCHPSPCHSIDNAEHHFGIWTVDYRPKPAVDVIRQFSGGS